MTAPETKGTRRRGAALVQAIHAATLAELIEHGPGGLSMERVADRARTGKSSVYRRWPTKEALLLDTLHHTLPSVDDPPDTGSLRGDLLAMLTRMSRVLAEPAGQAVRTLIAEGQRQPALVRAVDEQVLQPRIRRIGRALRNAAEARNTEPSDRIDLLAEVGPALVIHQLLLTGRPATDDDVARIIDQVILPAMGNNASNTER